MDVREPPCPVFCGGALSRPMRISRKANQHAGDGKTGDYALQADLET
jgi:hypothetical protein